MSIITKRIAIISPSFPPLPGGVSDYAFRLSSALNCCCEVHVITTEGLGVENTSDLTVHSVIEHWTWSAFSTLIRLLRHFRPSMILFQDGKEQPSNPYLLMLLPLILRLFIRCPVYLIVHEVEGERQQVQARLSSGVIVVEREYSKLFARLNRRVRCIHIGSNIPRSILTPIEKTERREQIGIVQGEIAVGFFGFISPHKGFEFLIKALSIVATEMPVCLVVLGEPIKNLILPNNFPIHWAGYLSPERVAETLASMDVNAFPFLNGARWRYTSLLAALVQDVPVVTTPGLKQPLAGVFECVPADVSDLAAKILVAAQTGQSKPREIPSWETVAMQIVEFAGEDIGAT